MCGIAGVVGAGAVAHLQSVEAMLAAMPHRGYDGQGLYVSPSGDCVLGHRRLAIFDLTSAAAQPMLNADRDWALVYNGACYNYLELRQELEQRGRVFRSTGDTEVVLNLLAESFANGLGKINGMFAVALWHEKERQLLLARDRFGQKPLYFVRRGDLTFFASELRSLLAAGVSESKIDLQGLQSYLAYGCVQEPDTIVADVKLLNSAGYMIIDGAGGAFSNGTYWRPPTIKSEAASEELQSQLSCAVARHLLSDAPIGIFLSGGLDSTAIAVAASHLGSQLKTLTVVFPESPQKSEGHLSGLVAKKIGSEHHEIAISNQEVLQALREGLSKYDQPTVDGFNTYLVSKMASSIGLKVAISGLGGDELFGGYPSFRDVPFMSNLRSMTQPFKSISSLFQYDAFDKTSDRVKDVLYSPPGIAPLCLLRRRIFGGAALSRLMLGLDVRCGIAGMSDERLALLEELCQHRAQPDAIALMEMNVYMEQMLLRDTDVFAMANNLEVRAPFLDNEFADFALSLPAGVRKPRSQSKWFLAKAVESWLPPELLARPKQGFVLPFPEWMLGPLASELESGFEALRGLSVIDFEAANSLLAKFRQSPQSVGWVRPWSLFVLGSYVARFKITV